GLARLSLLRRGRCVGGARRDPDAAGGGPGRRDEHGGGAGRAAGGEVTEEHDDAQEADDRPQGAWHEAGGGVDRPADPLEAGHAQRLVEAEGAEEDQSDGGREVGTRHLLSKRRLPPTPAGAEGASSTLGVRASRNPTRRGRSGP